MEIQHYSPNSMVCADAGVEVTKDNQFIHLRHSHQDGLQVLIEVVPCRVRAGHRGSIDADDVGEFASLKRQAEAHQAIIDALRQSQQSPHEAVSDGKDDARVL
nr:unnamed protein product [Spirometra erinaceieuropaei]